MPLLGRRKLPVDVPLGPHERVVAWAPFASPSEGYAVATDLGLRLPPGYDLLPWDRIDQAGWRDDVLTVVTDADLSAELRLAGGDRLAEVVRVRVEASIVLNRYRRLGRGGPGLRVVARRGADGTIRTAVRYEAGADPADPLVRNEADRFLTEVRAELGS